jgi:hypothetical protein
VPPVGFQNIEADGWSIDLPPEFTPDVDRPPESSMIWLVHQRDDRTPGAASILFARHAKPAEFSSRVFGLTALHGLHKSAGKKVVASRQHTVGGIEVTDIEVQVGSDAEGRRQWRRLLVYENVAYTLTYSARTQEAKRHRARAEAVLRSLYHAPPK